MIFNFKKNKNIFVLFFFVNISLTDSKSFFLFATKIFISNIYRHLKKTTPNSKKGGKKGSYKEWNLTHLRGKVPQRQSGKEVWRAGLDRTMNAVKGKVYERTLKELTSQFGVSEILFDVLVKDSHKRAKHNGEWYNWVCHWVGKGVLNEYLVNKEKRKAIQAKEKGRGRRREERNKLLERRVFIFFF